ncbi:MAG: metal ABC transporter permease [Alkalibacterium sp.]|nr:metal ABC transporter permease [Alkalibacterium sp.]
MSMITEITMIAVVVAVACALPGVFLVLRGVTMVSDAITHTVLLGIVLAFFITQDLNSPLLMIGATLVGVATVWLIETIQRSKLVSNDAAIGIVFPLFFSIAIIMITLYAGDVHLDEDAVLMGELAFAPFRRLDLFGYDLGPQSLWVMLVILMINALVYFLFYKELKLTTFDPAFAAALGFSPLLVHYALMTLVSLTAVWSLRLRRLYPDRRLYGRTGAFGLSADAFSEEDDRDHGSDSSREQCQRGQAGVPF